MVWKVEPYIHIKTKNYKEESPLVTSSALQNIFDCAVNAHWCTMICPNCNIKRSWCGKHFPGKEEERLHILKTSCSFVTIKHLPIRFKK